MSRIKPPTFQALSFFQEILSLPPDWGKERPSLRVLPPPLTIFPSRATRHCLLDQPACRPPPDDPPGRIFPGLSCLFSRFSPFFSCSRCCDTAPEFQVFCFLFHCPFGRPTCRILLLVAKLGPFRYMNM